MQIILQDTQDKLAVLEELSQAVNLDLLISLARAVLKARKEHPVLGDTYQRACTEAKSEILEWESQASLVQQTDGSLDAERIGRAEAEGMDVMVTQYRLLNREWGTHAS